MKVVNIKVSISELATLLSLLRKEIAENLDSLYVSELKRLRIKLEDAVPNFGTGIVS